MRDTDSPRSKRCLKVSPFPSARGVGSIIDVQANDLRPKIDGNAQGWCHLKQDFVLYTGVFLDEQRWNAVNICIPGPCLRTDAVGLSPLLCLSVCLYVCVCVYVWCDVSI